MVESDYTVLKGEQSGGLNEQNILRSFENKFNSWFMELADNLSHTSTRGDCYDELFNSILINSLQILYLYCQFSIVLTETPNSLESDS